MNDIASKLTPADQVFNWILSGAAQHEITDGIRQYFPDADSKSLIVAAFKRIEAAGEAEPDAIRGWCIEATRHVYQKALDAGDLSTALRAIKQLHGFSA